MRRSILNASIIQAVVAVVSLVGCSDEDGPASPTSRVIEGTWTLTVTVGESTCGGFPGEAETHCVTITRNGDIVTLSSGGETLTGMMITNSTAHFDLSGNGCTVDFILTLSADGTRLTGSNPVECPDTEWTEGCSEARSIVATRNDGC